MTNQYSYAEDFTASAKKPAEKQADPNISSAAKVYMISRKNKEDAAHGYRNGEFRGNKYMTSEDFVTYFRSRGKISYAEGTRKKTTEENAGEILRGRAPVENKGADTFAPTAEAAKKRAASDNDVKVYTPNGKKKASPNVSGRTEVFRRTGGERSERIKTAAREWFPEEKIVNVKTKRSPRRMVRTAAAIAGVALSLMMIVGGSVLVSDANREAKELESELRALEIQRNELSLGSPLWMLPR